MEMRMPLAASAIEIELAKNMFIYFFTTDCEKSPSTGTDAARKIERKQIYITNILAFRRRSHVWARTERDNINVWRQVDIFLRSIFASN